MCNCTNEILSGIGKMYAAGGAFTENINRYGGEGTAEFAAETIRIYCKDKKSKRKEKEKVRIFNAEGR